MKESATAVIGAGWAGCAAAVTLARLGHRVTVFEIAPTPGGRARRVMRVGLAIDNGQHLLLGAYRQTLNVIAAAGGDRGESDLARAPLFVEPLAEGPGTLALRARPLAPPYGLLGGLARARGLSWRARLAVARWFQRIAARGFRCAPGATVAEVLADGPPEAARALWNPLCLAALNTPPEQASGQVFLNVLAAAFGNERGASDFLVPVRDLSAVFPDRALRFVESQGGQCHLRTRALLARVDERAIGIGVKGELSRFDNVVLAVAPHQLAEVAADHAALQSTIAAARALHYEPIATVWLGYAKALPWHGRVARLDDAPGQWMFDRSDILGRASADTRRPPLAHLVSVVISASGPHEALEPVALASACDVQLRRLMPAWPVLAWSQTIVEKRATYACTPDRARAPSSQPHPRIALAGDWIDAEFPATLEAAVRSGVAAAFALNGGGTR